jgi:LacI family transcriptional regulator
MKNKKSTIKDVAKKAGVSISTVSLVVNNRPYVSIEVRDRVHAVIKELNFHPHRNARGLASKTSGNIGFILSENHFSQAEPFYTKIFLGTEFEARKHRYYVLLTTVAPTRTEGEEIPRFLLEHNVDGVIVAGKIHPTWIDELQSRNLPIVMIDFENPRYDLSSVMIDNASGVQKAMEYLTRSGHSEIAFIGGDIKHPSISARFLAYQDFLAGNGLPLRDNYISIDQEDTATENGFNAAKSIMTSSPSKPTAILAANDAMAIGVMRYLQSAGYIVPDDVSVVGFDNVEASEQTSPRLTTLNVPKEEMGAIAVNRLVELMQSTEKVTIKLSIGVQLILRDSTKILLQEVSIPG